MKIMKEILNMLLLLFVGIYGTYAQTAFSTLDYYNVSATFNNKNSLFWDGFGEPQFEAPKGSGKHSIFASALWIGGVNAQTDDIHLAATRFGQMGQDFYPGPIMNSEHYVSERPQYDRIFKLSCEEIEEFRAYTSCLNDPDCDVNVAFPFYVIPSDILDWPAHGDTTKGMALNLAPFVDVNGDNVYSPFQGDFPKIKGKQMLYFILSDDGMHTESGGEAMQIEIHVSAYVNKVFYGFGEDLDLKENAQNNTIYMNYKIINRSPNTYTNCYTGIWMDSDLGGAKDDYVGCFPSLNTYFTYNGDGFDENVNGASGYLDSPPAQGITFLAGPYKDADGLDNYVPLNTPGESNGIAYNDGIVDNERLGLSMHMYHNNSSGPTGDPSSAVEIYHFLQGIWSDGTHMVEGGNGHTNGCEEPFSCAETNYMFNHDNDVWNEVSSENTPGDRRQLGASGPFTFTPGQTQELDIAYVFAQADVSNDNFAAITKLKEYVLNLPSLSEHKNCQFDEIASVGPLQTAASSHIFPNPFNDAISIQFNSSIEREIELINLLGEKIFVQEVKSKSVKLQLPNIPKGTYFIKVKTADGSEELHKLIKS